MAHVIVRIKELLEEKAKAEGRKPITQDELAEAIGVPQGTLSRWINNKVDRLDTSIMAKLCLYFDCEVGDLIQLVRNV